MRWIHRLYLEGKNHCVEFYEIFNKSYRTDEETNTDY